MKTDIDEQEHGQGYLECFDMVELVLQVSRDIYGGNTGDSVVPAQACASEHVVGSRCAVDEMIEY